MFRLRPIAADRTALSSAPAVDLPEWPPRAGFFMTRQPLRSTAFLQLSANRQARRRLREDLMRVLDALPGGGLSVDIALEAATGVVLQVLAAIGEGRLKGAVAQPAVGAVLGAIGIGKQQAATTLAKLKRAKAAPVERAPAA